MPEVEKTLGVNSGEETTPSETHQPENKAPASEPNVNVDEIESEIDKTLTGEGGDDEDLDSLDAEDQGDDTVVLPKSKVEKLLRDKGNYKRGLLSIKEKAKGLKRSQKPPKADPSSPERKPGEGPVTKSELEKSNERVAIQSLTKLKTPTGEDNPAYNKDVDDNWAEVMKYFTPRHGSKTSDDVTQDVMDAYTLFRRDNPKKKDTEEGRETTAELGSENGSPNGGKKPEGGKPPERKHVLPINKSIKEWF